MSDDHGRGMTLLAMPTLTGSCATASIYPAAAGGWNFVVVEAGEVIHEGWVETHAQALTQCRSAV